MRNAIREYIELSDVEKKSLWDTATFVFDTNVFLNLYRYSQKTRDALLDAMTQLEDRIWMPYHVAYPKTAVQRYFLHRMHGQAPNLHPVQMQLSG